MGGASWLSYGYSTFVYYGRHAHKRIGQRPDQTAEQQRQHELDDQPCTRCPFAGQDDEHEAKAECHDKGGDG